MMTYRFLRASVLLLILAPMAWAQAPLVANRPPLPELARDLLDGSLARGGAEPDTTDWRRYFPLEIGNQWQYRVDHPDGGTRYYGYDIVGDTLLEGEHYFMVKTCYYREPILCSGTDSTSYHDFVRYDFKDPLLLERIEIDGEPYIEWWEHVPCLLDADFDSGPVPCASATAEYFVTGGHGYDYVLTPDTLRGVTYKRFDSIPTYTGVVAGIGVIWIEDAKNKQTLDVLIYARIGDEEYGERYFDFPTASEPSPPLVSTSEIRAVYPNPTRNDLNVIVSLSQLRPVSVEVVDLLGRVVRRRDLRARGPGEHTAQIDVSALSSGTYFVRVSETAGVSTPFTIAR